MEVLSCLVSVAKAIVSFFFLAACHIVKFQSYIIRANAMIWNLNADFMLLKRKFLVILNAYIGREYCPRFVNRLDKYISKWFYGIVKIGISK